MYSKIYWFHGRWKTIESLMSFIYLIVVYFLLGADFLLLIVFCFVHFLFSVKCLFLIRLNLMHNPFKYASQNQLTKGQIRRNLESVIKRVWETNKGRNPIWSPKNKSKHHLKFPKNFLKYLGHRKLN